MDNSHLFNLALKWLNQRVRQYCHPILSTFSPANRDLPHLEINIVHPLAQTLKQPQAGAIQQTDHQMSGSAEPFEQPAKRFPVEKKQRIERLILRGSRNIPIDCKVGQKRLDFRVTHLFGISLTMKQNIAKNPVDIGLFSTNTLVFGSNRRANTAVQAGLPSHLAASFFNIDSATQYST